MTPLVLTSSPPPPSTLHHPLQHSPNQPTHSSNHSNHSSNQYAHSSLPPSGTSSALSTSLHIRPSISSSIPSPPHLPQHSTAAEGSSHMPSPSASSMDSPPCQYPTAEYGHSFAPPDSHAHLHPHHRHHPHHSPPLSSSSIFRSLPPSLKVLRLPALFIDSLEDFLHLPLALLEFSFAQLDPALFSLSHADHKRFKSGAMLVPFRSPHTSPFGKSYLKRLPTNSLMRSIKFLNTDHPVQWQALAPEIEASFGSFYPPALNHESWMLSWHEHTHAEIELTARCRMKVPWYTD